MLQYDVRQGLIFFPDDIYRADAFRSAHVQPIGDGTYRAVVDLGADERIVILTSGNDDEARNAIGDFVVEALKAKAPKQRQMRVIQ
jgi:hypothetical protein